MRLFYAIELSASVRNKVANVQSDIRNILAGENVRWTNPDDFHITVAFLGEFDQSHLPRFEEAGRIAASAVAPFPMSAGQVGWFPRHDNSPQRQGKPPVLWVAGHDQTHSSEHLVKSIWTTLGKHDEAERRYIPHITIGYCRRWFSREQERRIEEALIAVQPCGEWTVERFVLMETLPPASRADSSSARYNTVRTFPLAQ